MYTFSLLGSSTFKHSHSNTNLILSYAFTVQLPLSFSRSISIFPHSTKEQCIRTLLLIDYAAFLPKSCFLQLWRILPIHMSTPLTSQISNTSFLKWFSIYYLGYFHQIVCASHYIHFVILCLSYNYFSSDDYIVHLYRCAFFTVLRHACAGIFCEAYLLFPPIFHPTTLLQVFF